MKKLHSFQVNYKAGEEEKTMNVVISKPTPRQHEAAEMEYAATIANFIRAGAMTRAMIFKRYDDAGGVFSENAENYILEVRQKYSAKVLEFTRLETKKESELVAEDRIKKTKVLEELNALQTELVEAEQLRDSIFENSAEKLTLNKMIRWWVFELIHVQAEDDEGEPVKLFKGADFEAKKDLYYRWEEEENPFWQAAKHKIFGMIWFLYYNQSAQSEDFAKHEAEFFPALKAKPDKDAEEKEGQEDSSPEPEPVAQKGPRKPRKPKE